MFVDRSCCFVCSFLSLLVYKLKLWLFSKVTLDSSLVCKNPKSKKNTLDKGNAQMMRNVNSNFQGSIESHCQ